ncbi:M20 family metallopeptidase [Spirillospora sp. NPDC048911]|uniref:M20 family metallopeptidase n=1 Tax=Spirillospora sp. NPDC048911 TaxID=3364527 RepID=UPI0037175821
MNLESLLGSADELLAIASTADRPDERRRALDYVLDFVGPGFTVERFEAGGSPSALLYAGGGGGARPEFRVIFNAHLDVVPGDPGQFAPRRDGDRLYARGAQDMKVSALVLARVFAELAPVLPYPIGLQLVTDEEVGGHHGTRHQLDQGVTGRFVVIGEYSALRVVTESKGLVNLRLHAKGRAGHSAYPWLGDNALVTLNRTLNAVLDAYPVPDGEVWRTTVNVARIETPNEAYNQIPARATAWLDVRYPPEDADLPGRTPAQIAKHFASFCVPGTTVEIGAVAPPHRADPESAEVSALQRAARAEGHSGDFLRKHGAADARFYYQDGIDAVIFGVGGDGQHGPDEYVDVRTIEPYYRALTRFLRDLPAGPRPDH